jgi:hypothetical protein
VEGVLSMVALNSSKVVLVAVLFSLTATAQLPLHDRIKIKIERFQSAPNGFDVLVSVENKGAKPVFLPRRPEARVVIALLGIQQWDEKLGWQYVSPCSDVAPMTTVELLPGHELRNTIPIRNMPHSEKDLPVCPRKIEHLGGKIRAILSRIYESDEQFKTLDPEDRVEIVTRPVALPGTE